MANILIVANSPGARRAISSMLMEANLAISEILEAGNGTESLAVLSSGATVNLILSTSDLPDMDSAEFVKTVRNRRRFVPILLASAEGNDEIPGSLLSSGAIDVITMPCTDEQLQEKVVRLA